MSFRLVPKSVTFNVPERRNGPYFELFHQICVRCCRKKFTFAISSPDEFHVAALVCTKPFIIYSGDVSPPLDNSRGIWMRLTSGVCSVYYAFPGGPTFLMKSSPTD